MTVDQLKAAIERRGYTVRLDYRDGCAIFEIYRDNGPITPETPCVIRSFPVHLLATISHSTVGVVTEGILAALSANHYHMACARCYEPLLQETGNTPHSAVAASLVEMVKTLPEVSEVYTDVYKFRSAKGGPYSPVLLFCPRCRQSLTARSVKEFDDRIGDAMNWTEQDLDRLAEITPADIASAGALWDANAPASLNGLLEAQPGESENKND